MCICNWTSAFFCSVLLLNYGTHTHQQWQSLSFHFTFICVILFIIARRYIKNPQTQITLWDEYKLPLTAR